MVAHTVNPSTQEAETGRSLVPSQPGLQSEFWDSQGYTEKPCLEKNQKQKKEKKKKSTYVLPNFSLVYIHLVEGRAYYLYGLDQI